MGYCSNSDRNITRVSTVPCEIHNLINCKWNNKKLPQQWRESDIVYIYKGKKKNECTNPVQQVAIAIE